MQPSFSDLLPILGPMGLDLEFSHGKGPVIHNPVHRRTMWTAWWNWKSVEALSFVTETVGSSRRLIWHPVVGFASAPFTLASYVIEGGASRNFLHTKTLMHRDTGAWTASHEPPLAGNHAYLNAKLPPRACSANIR